MASQSTELLKLIELTRMGEVSQATLHRQIFGPIVKRCVESMFDIEDYIDEAYWPEWIVEVGLGPSIIVKAKDQASAIKAAGY